jgi:hypothetical protein
MDDLTPRQPAFEEMIAKFEANARAFAARVERNPWTHLFRAAKAEAESISSDAPLDEFMRQFLAARKAGDPWLT